MSGRAAGDGGPELGDARGARRTGGSADRTQWCHRVERATGRTDIDRSETAGVAANRHIQCGHPSAQPVDPYGCPNDSEKDEEHHRFHGLDCFTSKMLSPRARQVADTRRDDDGQLTNVTVLLPAEREIQPGEEPTASHPRPPDPVSSVGPATSVTIRAERANSGPRRRLRDRARSARRRVRVGRFRNARPSSPTARCHRSPWPCRGSCTCRRSSTRRPSRR